MVLYALRKDRLDAENLSSVWKKNGGSEVKAIVIWLIVIAIFIAVIIAARYGIYTSDLPLWVKIMLLK